MYLNPVFRKKLKKLKNVGRKITILAWAAVYPLQSLANKKKKKKKRIAVKDKKLLKTNLTVSSRNRGDTSLSLLS